MPAYVDAPAPAPRCQVCGLRATHRVRWRSSALLPAPGVVYFRCDEHATTVRNGPSGSEYAVTPIEPEPIINAGRAHGTRRKETTMENLAEKTKSGEVTVKRPDFTCRVSRGARGIMLYVQSEALHAHLSGLAENRTTVNASGRTIFNVSMSRLRGASLFGISDAVTHLLLDAALNDGHEIKIMEVMTAPAAKDYVRDLMSAFTEYVRDYMSALRVTGSVTIDETVVRRAPITESV